MGDATGGSPIPLQAAIKTHALCEENAHLQHAQRLIRVLQCVTILLLSRACLYPPSKAVRLFTCLRPGPVRRFSYVQRRAYRDVSETPSEAAGNTAQDPRKRIRPQRR